MGSLFATVIYSDSRILYRGQSLSLFHVLQKKKGGGNCCLLVVLLIQVLGCDFFAIKIKDSLRILGVFLQSALILFIPNLLRV